VKVGDFVFYPAHGVAEVAGIEDREIAGQQHSFYVLEILSGGRSLVPTENIESAGIRKLVSQNKAKNLLKKMKTTPTLDNTKTWKERAADYADGLKTGACDRYTDILLELMHRAKLDKLSATEQRHLEVARNYFLGELSTVLKTSPDKLELSIAASVSVA